MSKPLVVFHCPKELKSMTSATSVRPLKMMNALSKRYDVVNVVGAARERKKAWAEVRSIVLKGVKPLFLYSEPSTSPMNLSNGKKECFLGYDLDWKNFLELKRSGLSIGLFYRDAHWMFPEIFSGHPVGKYLYFHEYKRDLRKIALTCKVVFYSSDNFAKQVQPLGPCDWMALPPGTDGIEVDAPHYVPGKLKTIYVGGIGGSLYDCGGLFSVLSKLPQVNALIITRPQEWVKVENIYGKPGNVKVEHRSSDALGSAYMDAEVSLMYYEPARYRNLIIPYKVFESVDYERPIISSSGSAAADYIEKEGIGWVVKNQDELEALFFRLISDKNEIRTKVENMRRVKRFNTWDKRVMEIEEALLKGVGVNPPLI